MKLFLTALVLSALNFNVEGQNQLIEYSLYPYTIVINVEHHKDSIYYGKATFYISDKEKLLNSIEVPNYYYKSSVIERDDAVNCLVDFNNDGISELVIRTKYNKDFDKSEYKVFSYNKTLNKFVIDEVATNFQNENKGRAITSHRTKDRLSIYDINEMGYRQISEYSYNKNKIVKTKVTIEDLNLDSKYAIVTILTFENNGTPKTTKKRYLKRNYFMDE